MSLWVSSWFPSTSLCFYIIIHALLCCLTQVPGGHRHPSGRSKPCHSHYQLQREALSDWQRVPNKTQTVRGGCQRPGKGQSQRCNHEGPGGYSALTHSVPFSSLLCYRRSFSFLGQVAVPIPAPSCPLPFQWCNSPFSYILLPSLFVVSFFCFSSRSVFSPLFFPLREMLIIFWKSAYFLFQEWDEKMIMNLSVSISAQNSKAHLQYQHPLKKNYGMCRIMCIFDRELSWHGQDVLSSLGDIGCNCGANRYMSAFLSCDPDFCKSNVYTWLRWKTWHKWKMMETVF